MIIIKTILYLLGLVSRRPAPPTFRELFMCTAFISIVGFLCLLAERRKAVAA